MDRPGTALPALPSTPPSALPEPPVSPQRDRSEIHHTHRDVTGGWLRPAVFGVMDGLVSNVALITGVAAAETGRSAVLVAGFAGLVAGAFSMATGEYVSVTSQAELARAEIATERAELARVPQAEQDELAAVYRARGLTPELAAEVARQLSADPEQALRIHVREELGVDPDDLPSAWVAAGSSLAAFAVGAFLPLLPYLLGASSLVWSLLVAAAGLLGAGALVSRFTGRPAWVSGLRQLVLGACAAAVTFGVGHLVGAAIS
ncbi:MAG: VIT1/CCC1 transporter family protein [Frankiaceae bacterium]